MYWIITYIEITALELTAPNVRILNKVVCSYYRQENNSYNIRTTDLKFILKVIAFFFNKLYWVTTKEY